MPKGLRGFQKGNKLGRKKARKTIVRELARQYIEKRIMAELGDILEAKIELAKGLRFKDKLGLVFTDKPNAEANEQCLQRVAGKVKDELLTEGVDAKVREKVDILSERINKFLNNETATNNNPAKDAGILPSDVESIQAEWQTVHRTNN